MYLSRGWLEILFTIPSFQNQLYPGFHLTILNLSTSLFVGSSSPLTKVNSAPMPPPLLPPPPPPPLAPFPSIYANASLLHVEHEQRMRIYAMKMEILQLKRTYWMQKLQKMWSRPSYISEHSFIFGCIVQDYLLLSYWDLLRDTVFSFVLTNLRTRVSFSQTCLSFRPCYPGEVPLHLLKGYLFVSTSWLGSQWIYFFRYSWEVYDSYFP